MWERTITLNGFSKAFAMTGWRLGYACGPKQLLEPMVKIHQYTMMCAPNAAQYAALEALKIGAETDYEDIKRMARVYDRRRRLVVEGLNAMGLPCHEPLGAFYAFPSIAHTGLSSQAFATKLLEKTKVAAVPGDAFGEGGEGHLRISYATATEKLAEALERIRGFVRGL
jgi:aminotransferase